MEKAWVIRYKKDSYDETLYVITGVSSKEAAVKSYFEITAQTFNSDVYAVETPIAEGDKCY